MGSSSHWRGQAPQISLSLENSHYLTCLAASSHSQGLYLFDLVYFCSVEKPWGIRSKNNQGQLFDIVPAWGDTDTRRVKEEPGKKTFLKGGYGDEIRGFKKLQGIPGYLEGPTHLQSCVHDQERPEKALLWLTLRTYGSRKWRLKQYYKRLENIRHALAHIGYLGKGWKICWLKTFSKISVQSLSDP